MKNKFNATISNFNCTQRKEGQIYPMVSFFNYVIWPALNDKTLFRETGANTSRKIKYHISDIKLMQIDTNDDINPYVVVGKHIKRTILDIMPDYDINKGFIGNKNSLPSAPYSTFILFLHNHKLIYFPNNHGAPNIKAFSATINHIIFSYISEKRKKANEKLIVKRNKSKKIYYFNDIQFNTIKEFKEKYLDINYPFPEINVVPIESQTLVDEAFSKITSIQNLTFKFYRPNNEPLNFDDLFQSIYASLEKTQSSSVSSKFSNPENIDAVHSGISSSQGKVDYIIKARGENDEKLSIEPSKISPQLPIEINDEDCIEKIAKDAYNQLKDNKCLTEISKDNKEAYEKYKNSISVLNENE